MDPRGRWLAIRSARAQSQPDGGWPAGPALDREPDGADGRRTGASRRRLSPDRQDRRDGRQAGSWWVRLTPPLSALAGLILRGRVSRPYDLAYHASIFVTLVITVDLLLRFRSSFVPPGLKCPAHAYGDGRGRGS